MSDKAELFLIAFLIGLLLGMCVCREVVDRGEFGREELLKLGIIQHNPTSGDLEWAEETP